MKFASLSDLKKQDEASGKATQSYTGGEKSGLAVQNPEGPDYFERCAAASHAVPNTAPPVPANTKRSIVVYRDGFTVDGGEFRPLTDPINMKFMKEIEKGYAPSELQKASDKPVNVELIDKRSEEYKEPPAPQAQQRFSGEGMRLDGGASRPASASVCLDAGSVQIDASKPKTKIQIRFHDGQRRVQEFNEDQTVGDLRRFCNDCAGIQSMKILEGFPPKEIVDDSQTLKAAGLLNSAVTVKP